MIVVIIQPDALPGFKCQPPLPFPVPSHNTGPLSLSSGESDVLILVQGRYVTLTYCSEWIVFQEMACLPTISEATRAKRESPLAPEK
jgi:hypothetical protein